MSRMTTARRIATAIATLGLAVTLGSTWNTTRAQGEGSEPPAVTLPLATAGLIPGEGLRTTIANLGRRSVGLQVIVRDVDGAVIKSESLEVAPRQTRSVETSRAQAGRSESSVGLRTEILAQRADADDLDITVELIDWTTGATRMKFDRISKDIEDKQDIVQFRVQ
jgi:hypothetical protein